MEWNARAQITTWYPTSSPSRLGSGLSPQDNDYARKQWGGLVAGYYAARAALSLEQAEVDAAASRPFSAAQVEDAEAKLSYDWQTDFGNVGPTRPVGDPVAVSAQMRAKYAQYFDICSYARMRGDHALASGWLCHPLRVAAPQEGLNSDIPLTIL
jgi:alpha-N-acetylglucosaminidase